MFRNKYVGFVLKLVAAKIMEMGPVLVVTFQAQQIAYIADANGKVIEGDPVSDLQFLFFESLSSGVEFRSR